MSLPVRSRRRPPPFARENKSSGGFQAAAARGAGAAAAMGLLERCRDEFGTADLYEVLGVRREASDGEIRRGYHKVSLRVHPDRVAEAGRQEATRQFQILGKVYAVLSDAEKRAVYDEQGTVDEESEALSQERDWAAYWRLLFKKITLEDIQKFEEKYVGSEEELADIKQAYADFEGDMDRIMASVLCAEHSDEPRVRTIIQRAIDSGELPPYSAFLEEPERKVTARKRRAQKEAKEAEKTRRELGLGDEPGALTALIQSRQKNRVKEMDSFLAQMEAKYCNASKRRKTNIKGKK